MKNSSRLSDIFPNVDPKLINLDSLDKMPYQWYTAGQKTDNSTGLNLVGYVSLSELRNCQVTRSQVRVYKPNGALKTSLTKRSRKMDAMAKSIRQANGGMLEDLQEALSSEA
jgi:hypothetical protein